ncbi:MAG: DUF2183 domain-containing protein [Actinomycetaceae bacterium]|nr:DUF2183 domain-containing protein [Actinomycetaceae bacterium]
MGLAHFARSFEENVNRRGIVKRRAQGWLPELIPYTGYGSTTQVRVLARALMTDPETANQSFTLPFLPRSTHTYTPHALNELTSHAEEAAARAQRGWRQFFTTQVGFLKCTVKIGEKTIEARTDRSGYIDLVVENHGLAPGWHDVEIIPIVGDAVKAPVMIVSPDATTGLVSDIDDTIVVTWLPRMFLAAWNSFVKHTNTRQPVPGMADFYRELLKDTPSAPVFYLSTGAWNTYSTLLNFMQLHEYPVGPMLMTDWGPTPTSVFRSGQEHKKTELRNLLVMFPNIKWYLVGDDGQHDPLIYDELARDHPSRVKAIMLRQLNVVEQVLSHGAPDAQEAQREDSDIEDDGIVVIRGKDGNALAQAARRIGLIK